MACVCSPVREDLAPFRIPLRPEAGTIVGSPNEFAQHVLARVAEESHRAKQLSKAQRRTALQAASDDAVAPAASGGKAQVHLGLPSWLLKAEISGEVATAAAPTGTRRRSTAEFVDQLRRVLEVIKALELQPVLLLDDTDAWTAVDARSGQLTAAPFLREIPRLLADLPTTSILAVHDHYVGTDAWQDATGFISAKILIPAFHGSGELDALLSRRLALVSGDGAEQFVDIFDDDARAELFALYQSGRSLRKVFSAAREALQESIDIGADRVIAGHIAAVVARDST
jgi:hypothetical protein